MFNTITGRRGRERMVVVQSVPITTKVVSSNPIHDELHLIQHYVMKFVSDSVVFSSFVQQ